MRPLKSITPAVEATASRFHAEYEEHLARMVRNVSHRPYSLPPSVSRDFCVRIMNRLVFDAFATRFIHEEYDEDGLFSKAMWDEIPARCWIDATVFNLIDSWLSTYEYSLNDDAEDGVMTPYVLGHVMERYNDQKHYGAYYTDPAIARRMAVQAVESAFLGRFGYGVEEIPDLDREGLMELNQGLHSFRLLDPACGSGAILMELVEAMETVYTAINYRERTVHGFDPRPMWREINCVPAWRAIHDNVFGIELQPGPAECARMRLMLRAVAAGADEASFMPDWKDHVSDVRLNVKIGNALVGSVPNVERPESETIWSAVATEKTDDERLLDDFHAAGAWIEEPSVSQEGEIGRSRKRRVTLDDIEALRPLYWGKAFPEAFADGGFDAVVMNPPWESFRANPKEWFQRHDETLQVRATTAAEFTKRRTELLADPLIRRDFIAYVSAYTHVASYFGWAPHLKGGADEGGHNLFQLFCRQALNVLREGGAGVVLTPSGILTDAGCRTLRETLFDKNRVDWTFTTYNYGTFEGVAVRFRYTITAFTKGGSTESWDHFCGKSTLDDLFAFPKEGGHAMDVPLVRSVYPDSLTVPLTRNADEIDILRLIASHPVAGRERSDGQPKRRRRKVPKAELFAALEN